MLLSWLLAIPVVLAAPALHDRGAIPTVQIFSPQATIIGLPASGGVESFNGIPFAQQPVGALRLKPPQPLTSPQGVFLATATAKACPQFSVGNTDYNNYVFDVVDVAGEDCLTVNVRRPAGTTASSKLPVLFWIFGGSFQVGATSLYDGARIVANSLAIGKPVVLVTVNYRLGGFGFLGGKEILADGSANLGHLDQRLGMKWVADNIAAFGGDPDKVTIWGESAGSISTFNHLVLYNGDNSYKGKPLFRAAILNSGSIVPTDPVDSAKPQQVYNQVVLGAGCAFAKDTLACLRLIPYTTLLRAMTSVLTSATSAALPYMPRQDGTVLSASTDILAATGRIATVPLLVGDQEDEGTLFALGSTNLVTTSDVVSYLKSAFFGNAAPAVVQTVINTYPQDVSAGSPFGTGLANNIYPQYKRLAAFLGDFCFTLQRRAFLNSMQSTKPNVPVWSYLSSAYFNTPTLGTYHGSDVLAQFFGVNPNFASSASLYYYLNFAYNLDPNNAAGTMANASYAQWPQWKAGNSLLHLTATGSDFIPDNFRSASYNAIMGNLNSLRV